MKKITFIYFSGSGSTGKFAESIGKGVSSVESATLKIISIDENDIIKGRYKNDAVINQLETSDAVIFGTPTYMAGCAAQFKAFADATIGTWSEQKWKNKIAAGFTVSGTPSGDKVITLQYLQAFAMQHGMIWLGTGEMPVQSNGVNRLGTWIGAMAFAEQNPVLPITKDDLLSGEVFGRRIADFTINHLR
ncbi:flavodoxin family protein [Flavobacterium sp. FlaQc-48]|uniref:flavodoxin family protein n=1 Tax=Flavobacterium sp. FlaQc-48 TaxID=3374181 RepID=UPI003757B092